MTAPLDQRRDGSPRRRKWIRWVFRLLVVYTVLGFLVLPPIVRLVAVKRLSRELDREVSIKSVRINPYVLSCSVRGLLIKDRDGEPFVSWDNVYVNFQLASFFGRPWVFKEISATNIFIRAQLNKDNTFNFSDLIAKFSKPGEPTAPSRPLALRVDTLNIGGARASLTDLTPRQPFRRVIGPIHIALRDFHTDPTSRNPYTFTGSTDSGEVFAWSGNFSLNPIRAEGELSVDNVTLNKYAPLYQDLVRFEIRDGVAGFHIGYQFASDPTNRALIVTNLTATLRSFKLAEPGADGNLVDLPSFSIAGVSGDLIRRQFDAGSLSVTGAVMNLQRNRDAAVNVVEIAKPALTATNTPGGIVLLLRAATNLFSMFLNTTNTATATLHLLSVDNCAVTVDDEVNSRPVTLVVDRINVTATNLSNLPGTNLSATASLRWNTNGTLRADIAASAVPPAADVHVVCDQLALRPLDPYLEPFVNLFIIDSKMGLDGRIKLRGEPGQLPVVTFAGGYRLDDFATVDGELGEDLVKWGSLRVDGIEANLNPPVVSIDKVELDDALARFTVETNGSINLLAALRPQRAGLSNFVESTAPVNSTAKSAKGTLSGVKAVMTGTNELAVGGGFGKLSIASIVISNAQLQWTDRSLTPQVRASLEQVHGTITDISSDELRHAHIQLEGKMGGTGPIEITGELNPLQRDAAASVKVVMKDVDLNPGDPYTEKFLGYRLRKGKLSLEVNYELTARKLKGQNLIHLDQFTLGDKVQSPDATKLPVKLGIALLKDRAGKIELDVPVEGNLDDPEFRLNRVIWHAVVNVFTKIVTSPFAVLGSLFGGKGEEVGFQNFNPGASDLLPSEAAKLDGLAKGMYERPGLEVEIEGNVDVVADREGLRRVKLERELRLLKWRSLRKSEQTSLSVEQIVLAPEERTRLLDELYLNTPGVASQTNAPGSAVAAAGRTTSGSGASEKGAQILMRPQPTPEEREQVSSEKERRLLDSISVSDGELRDLAAERARQVQNYLVQTTKVESERVFLAQNVQGNAGTNGHRVYLHLQ